MLIEESTYICVIGGNGVDQGKDDDQEARDALEGTHPGVLGGMGTNER